MVIPIAVNIPSTKLASAAINSALVGGGGGAPGMTSGDGTRMPGIDGINIVRTKAPMRMPGRFLNVSQPNRMQSPIEKVGMPTSLKTCWCRKFTCDGLLMIPPQQTKVPTGR